MGHRRSGTALAAWCGGLGAFQVGLAAGLPWGAAAWGGRHAGVLPVPFRVASGVAAAGVATVGVVTAGRGEPGLRGRMLVGVMAYCALGIAANAASPSRPERLVGVPISVSGLALAALALREHRADRTEGGRSSGLVD